MCATMSVVHAPACLGSAPRAACVRKAPALARVWCPELSVLDCEVDGERWVWSVPARAGNDTETGNAAQVQGSAENSHRSPARKLETCNAARKQTVIAANQHQNSEKRVALADWLRGQQGLVSP